MQSFRTLNRNYQFSRTVVTNITSEYVNDSGSKWDSYSMVRESIQNMLDEADRLSRDSGDDVRDYYQFYKYWDYKIQTFTHLEFRDKGCGVDFEQIFLLGASGKRGQDYKGHKGEGEVLSFLVAAREGIEKWMFSKCWAVTPKLVTQAGYQVLALDIYETNKPIEGTVWRYDLTPELLNIFHNIGEYFPEMSRRESRKQETQQRKAREERYKNYDKQQRQQKAIIRQNSTASTKCIITPKNEARLYVRGVFVKPIHANFSYNLNVEINRDRTMVDEFAILDGISAAFDSEDLTQKQCELYWKNCNDNSDYLEYRRAIRVEVASKNYWMMRAAFNKVFGKKVFIPTVPVATMDAMNDGWEPVDLPNFVKDTALHLNLETDKTVNGYVGDTIPLTLNDTHLKLIDQLKKIGKVMGLGDYPVNGAKKSLKDVSALGFYQMGEITLFEKTLNGDRLTLLETYIHECGHGDSGESDGTRGFTQWFETQLIKSLIGKNDSVRPLINEFLEM